MSADPILTHFRHMKAAYIVLLIVAIPTVFGFVRVRANIRARDLARFDRTVNQTQSAIDRRIVRCLDQMYNMRALFAASENIGRDEWKAYLGSMTVRHSELGIRSIGYIERVTPAALTSFLDQRRADMKKEFSIVPAGERSIYYPTVFTTHFDIDAEVIYGLDHAVRPERMLVMDQAIERNRPFMTERAKFMGSDGMHTNTGIFVYLPVYKKSAPLNDRGERRQATEGLIYMTMIPQKLLGLLFENQEELPEVSIEVFDGDGVDPDRVLYNSDAALHSLDAEAHGLKRKVTMQVLNRQWTISFATLPQFEAHSPHYLAWLTLFGGLTASLLLFGITGVQVKARSRAEQDAAVLHRSEAALAAEKERLAVTLYSITDGVITTDARGRIVSINKAAEALTGHGQQQAEGKALGEIYLSVNEQTREPRTNPVDTVLVTGEEADSQSYALLLRGDGTERVITDSAAPIHDKAGKVLGTVLVFRDVTEKRKTEAEMLKESKLESVGLLAGGIAHDFNNILMGILGNISLARMSAHSTEKMLERLTGLEKSAIRARDLTQQLLTFAKGGAPICKRVQLPGLIKDACQFAMHGSNVQAEYLFSPDSWPVEVDEGQVRQAFNHLFINAMQAMPSGGTVEIVMKNTELTAGALPPLPPGKYVKISICDHGAGIQPKHLPRIFEPYFTTKKNGSGLGLATAYSVVRRHEGQIRVESALGSGTRFHIYLPASLEVMAEEDPGSDPMAFFGEGRLLLMDDEPDVLLIASAMLRACGYEVETATDGMDAIERYTVARASGRPFDAIIMDLTIPNGMGGREAVARLKEIDPEVKAIVSSGYSFDPVMANYRQYGFRGIIPKPYRVEELGRVLQDLLKKSASST